MLSFAVAMVTACSGGGASPRGDGCDAPSSCGASGGASGGGGQAGAGGSGAGGNADTGAGGAAGASGAGGNGTGGDNGVGAGGNGTAGSGGAGADFQAVLAIFTARCVLCHDSAKHGLPAYPQLSLTPAEAYGALVSHPADETCGGTRVVPGSAASSYLYHKLTDATPCDGARMPRPFEIGTPTPLGAADLATIQRWIDEGAPP
jgi:hypothetical protein